ncbi:MAG TPA: DUF4142 domain-containing protein [Rhizobiaceae bacterium]|nr:DUF4142 domain-containing protein [Rhizobiaceae bacterium]
MRTYILAAAFASAAMIGTAQAQPPMTAQKFVNMAAIGGMFEVKSSEVALQKGKGKDIKSFAHMMIHDHGAANKKLAAIAARQHLSIPGDLDTKHQGDLDTLRKTKGAFDPAYIQMQQKAHDEAVMLFSDYAQDGKDKSLKSFAKETLPTLKMHKQKISAIAKKDKVD